MEDRLILGIIIILIVFLFLCKTKETYKKEGIANPTDNAAGATLNPTITSTLFTDNVNRSDPVAYYTSGNQVSTQAVAQDPNTSTITTSVLRNMRRPLITGNKFGGRCVPANNSAVYMRATGKDTTGAYDADDYNKRDCEIITGTVLSSNPVCDTSVNKERYPYLVREKVGTGTNCSLASGTTSRTDPLNLNTFYQPVQSSAATCGTCVGSYIDDTCTLTQFTSGATKSVNISGQATTYRCGKRTASDGTVTYAFANPATGKVLQRYNITTDGTTCPNRGTFQETTTNVDAIPCSETWVDNTCTIGTSASTTNTLGTYECGVASDSNSYYGNITTGAILQNRTNAVNGVFGGSTCPTATVRNKPSGSTGPLNVTPINCEFGQWDYI
jgi:hypothetical protein